MNWMWIVVLTTGQLTVAYCQSDFVFPDENYSGVKTGVKTGVKSGVKSGVKTGWKKIPETQKSEIEDFHFEDGSQERFGFPVKAQGNFHPAHVWPPQFSYPMQQSSSEQQPGNNFGHPFNNQPGHPHFGQPHPGYPGHPHLGHPHPGNPHPGHIQPGWPHINFPGQTQITPQGQYVKKPFNEIKTVSKLDAQNMPPIGDCSSFKKLPVNSNIKCQNVTKTCRVTCLQGYEFPGGTKSVQLSCVNKEWIIKDSNSVDIPSCQAVCKAPCQNNGICIAPGLCQCPQNFHGPMCQYKKLFCPSYPPVPNHSNMTCNAMQCTIQCLKGYKFPGGSEVTNMICEDGRWMHTATRKTSVPDCEPTCNPICRNGGSCEGHNYCMCLKSFHGPQCQYDHTVCNITKAGFNGIYFCTFKRDEVSCKIRCPSQIEFEFTPAPEYVCQYHLDTFYPENIPKCKYPPGSTIVQTSKWGELESSNSEHDSKSGIEMLEIFPTMRFKSDINKVYSIYASNKLTLREPAPAMCSTWGGNNIKTFDGVFYKIPLHCSHVLMEDTGDDIFHIVFNSCPYRHQDPCHYSLTILFRGITYKFTNEDGEIKLRSSKKEFPLPVQILGMNVIPVAHLIKINFDKSGIVVYWDKSSNVLIQANSNWWERTAGLCGTLDNNPKNDFISKTGSQMKTLKSFVDIWQVQYDDNDRCLMPDKEDFQSPPCRTDDKNIGLKICHRLINNGKLEECLQEFSKDTLINACAEEYCKCTNDDKQQCPCEFVSVLAEDCMFKGVKLSNEWRDLTTCPMSCKKGRVYSSCGPVQEPTCGYLRETSKDTCHEGCFCPDDLVSYNGNCIPVEDCPCTLRNKEFKPGSQYKKDCNTCTCIGGIWNCTDITCGARCAVVGDPHYVTFDGKRYDFMGKCSYYLMKTKEITVEAENVPCPGTISADLNIDRSTSTELPSCTKSVTIRAQNDKEDYVIKLAQGPVVYVNEREVEHYPKTIGKDLLMIRPASSTFISVDFSNGLRVWWDGETRVYVDAPASYRNQTTGLCGTFNSNTRDDFLTPEGDIENAVEPFAMKWEASDTCGFAGDAPSTPYPCDANPQNKEKAEKLCDYILSEAFEDCHWTVDPEPYFENCMYDVCACDVDASKCLCPILASYGDECARNYISTEWRTHAKECSLECPVGQVYDECGDGCLRTCEDISRNNTCAGHCVEGCRCPDGEYLNHESECIPQEKCPCWYEGSNFQSGYKEIRSGPEFLELCTCSKGSWQCKEATEQDRREYPSSSSVIDKCESEPNSEFTKCMPKEQKTCKNLQKYTENFEDCVAGCVCKIGYILDPSDGKCVRPEDCSCHHGGKSYSNGEEIQEDCSTCLCKSGSWDCVKGTCTSTCTVWGDSHFTTFDGKDFDFQGACDYVLSKGVDENGNGFSITIQNVLCGSLGVTCSKSVQISLTGKTNEKLELSSDPADESSIQKYKKVDSENPQTFVTYNAGVFVVVEVLDLGLQLKWDRGTRVYINLNDKWKGRVSGLCGNFNDNTNDDMKTPSMGLEASPLMFGHSWKLHDYCTIPTEPVNACEKHPERESWAHSKCSLLTSPLFEPCHSEVPHQKYLKRCIFDSCACDQGGDCECLCTALAAYAYACSKAGISIKWRTPHLCPMQCDANCSNYSPCTESCPVETCDNFLEQGISERMCLKEKCSEGCHVKPCENGFIYKNDSFLECVPKSSCKPICMEKDGVLFYEGDVVYSDECQTCRCSRKKEVCSGAPCTTTPDYTTTLDDRTTSAILTTSEQPMILIQTTHPPPLPVLPASTSSTAAPSIHTTGPPLEICDPKMPIRAVVGDCFRYYHCIQQPGKGAKWEEKTCGPTMMFNEITGSCASITYVTMLKPECQYQAQATPTPSTHSPLVVEKCSSAAPINESPRDCHNYVLCVEVTKNDWQYIEKTCPNGKMFNPRIMECDNVLSVLAIKPTCAGTSPTTETPELCPPGEKWSECAVHCTETCHYYKKVLQQKGLCKHGDKCEAGCVNIKLMQDCLAAGKLWRNQNSCVNENECPCMNDDGSLVKPHAVFQPKDDAEAKDCQCLNNKVVCSLYTAKVEVSLDKEIPSQPHLTSSTTRSPVTMTSPTTILRLSSDPVCPDDMEVSNGEFHPKQVTASSVVWPKPIKGKKPRLVNMLKISSPIGWKPVINTPNQYVIFDFLKPRNITGLTTKGGPDGWVTGYKVMFSKNGKLWNKIVDSEGVPQAFDGNRDSNTPKTNYFQYPVNTQFIKIIPVEWRETINMRIEPIGCFDKYSEPTVETEPEPNVCPICPNVEVNTLPMDDNCKCREPLFWDGKKCIESSMCPCIENHVSYEIGVFYENDRCEECVCVLGGISECSEKKCPPCGENLRRDKKSCACICLPCPPRERLCPSSGDCIPENLWCNGFMDCEDDERDCPGELPSSTTEVSHVETYVNKTCRPPDCPNGMILRLTGESQKQPMSEIFDTSFIPEQGQSQVPFDQEFEQEFVEEPFSCPVFVCEFPTSNIPKECPNPHCPKGYDVQYELHGDPKSDKCKPYTCIPARQEDDICEISGKTFKTFDNTEFKYDVCNHILARDLEGSTWSIIMNVSCPINRPCDREVLIKDTTNGFTLSIFPDLSVKLNNFNYTVRQLEGIAAKFRFIISQPGDTVLMVSKDHGFWVSFDSNGDVKIGVCSKYVNTVDGLCGFYSKDPDDDKSLPSGELAKNTVEFGDSWITDEGSKDKCQPRVCAGDPTVALQICTSIKDKVFEPCANVVDHEGFISKCMESTCECLQNDKNNTIDMDKFCKCSALERFVKQCLAAKPDVYLDTWRAIQNCEIKCAPPLVYKECFKRRCEPSCDTVGKNECPLLPDKCFSGCFCPDGLVRKGDTCVSVTECKDCVCKGIGRSKYVTYDSNNFTFDGNCSYLLSRDLLIPGVPTFQIYGSLKPCEAPSTKTKESKSFCLHSLHILHGNHIVHLQRSLKRAIQVLVDGQEAKSLPMKNKWIEVTRNGNEIQVVFPESQLDILTDFTDSSFSIQLPSVKYGQKLEGLCGDCNGDPSNDLQINPKYTKPVKDANIATVADSWRPDDPNLKIEDEECITENALNDNCIPPDPEVDPCLKIYDSSLFGRCHIIVDPVMYVAGCQQDLCNQKESCESLAAYAKECAKHGVCVDWRKKGLCPYDCPAPKIYKPCDCEKTCESLESNDIFAVIDIRSDAVMDTEKTTPSCIDLYEGCFCPEGKVLSNDSCIPQEECVACEDPIRNIGEVWKNDKCTECTCNLKGKTICIKTECAVLESVCADGFIPIKKSFEDECCEKFICVPAPTPSETICPKTLPLECASDQKMKIITDKNGCQQFICECKPIDQCDLPRLEKPLKKGQKMINETKGCCPSHKVVCDKQLCEPKPTKCNNTLLEVRTQKLPDECCPIYSCAPPKDTCLVEIDGEHILKRFGDKWADKNDPCTTFTCSFGPKGDLTTVEEQEMCDIKCAIGFKYSAVPGKCCGKCSQAMCILGDRLFKVDEVWYSNDNCTKYSCTRRENEFFIASYEETCPDVSNCPKHRQEKKGCCTVCRLAPASQVLCIAETLAEPETRELIQAYHPAHGLCINKTPIRGFTECQGTCLSGHSYNKYIFGYEKHCTCCSVKTYKDMKIPLVCSDGYQTEKLMKIPESCACQPCDMKIPVKAIKGVKTVKG